MNNFLLKEHLIIEQVFLIRGEKVLFDFDLANLYGVEVKQLKRSVNRNIDRFPSDFMFQLTKDEYDIFRNRKGKGIFSKFLPYAFTEQGVAMLSGILRSERAIQVNITIMRAFVQMRQFVESNKELIKKVEDLESNMNKRLQKQDEKVSEIFDAIKYLIRENNKPKKPIGFHLPEAHLESI